MRALLPFCLCCVSVMACDGAVGDLDGGLDDAGQVTGATGGGTAATGGGTATGGGMSTGGGSAATGGGTTTQDSGAVMPDSGVSMQDAGVAMQDAGVPLRTVFVAVGYNALRVRSLDLGLTWVDEQLDGTSGDNEFLIRGVGFGHGLFVAARGYPSGLVRTSPDGATWTTHTAPSDQWMAEVLWAGDRFVAVGSNRVWTSADGFTWAVASPFPTAMRALVQGVTRLMAAGSNGQWWRSDDHGASWSLDSASHTASNEVKIAACGSGFSEIGVANYSGLSGCQGFTRARGIVHANGVWLRANNGIERSTDGTTWTKVYSNGGVEDVEVGQIP